MHRPIITILLLFAVSLASGANDKEQTAAEAINASSQQALGKAKGDQSQSATKTAKADKSSACMHCGATCGLTAICVCEPGPSEGRAAQDCPVTGMATGTPATIL